MIIMRVCKKIRININIIITKFMIFSPQDTVQEDLLYCCRFSVVGPPWRLIRALDRFRLSS